MASESPPPPPQSLKGELWDTAPDTFLAREAIKRLDLKECYLSDDAVMKIQINKSEMTITGVNIWRFNDNVFLKGGHLKSKHKGRGAPALAPDGTVMTMLGGTHRTAKIVLNGGDNSLPVGDCSVENYRAMSDHPKYNEWLAKVKWTAADALRAGIPLTSINATVTTLAEHVQQTPSEPEGNSDALQEKKEDSPQPNNTNGLGNEVQPNNADDSMNQRNRTPSRSVTPPETPLEETPSEYATLSSTYSEITTSKPTTPEPSPEPATSEPVIPQPVTSQPITPGSVTSQSATLELAVSEPAASEPVVSEPATSDLAASQTVASEPSTSDLAASQTVSLEPTTLEPTTSDLAASQPVALEPTTPDTAASALEPTALESTAFESATSGLATSDPLVSKPTVSKSTALKPLSSEFTISEVTLERSASEPVTTKPTASEPEPTALEPDASMRAASEPIPLESFASISIKSNINFPGAPKPNTTQSQTPASVRKQSASPGPALINISLNLQWD
ncbi:hypothetical protein VE00_03749 [Pseudogymnoascus sp. WSF 3629]|nr:hypothetical protein VE00_03749 [Pseudogymnoascus sp. WSF 3629]